MPTPLNTPALLDGELRTENFERLTELIAALFIKWELSADEKRQVLSGIFEDSNSRMTLSAKDIPRVEFLLTIHGYLRLLFPQNPDMRYAWIKRPNRFFDGRSPLTVIIDEGIVGMEAVARYLQTACLN